MQNYFEPSWPSGPGRKVRFNNRCRKCYNAPLQQTGENMNQLLNVGQTVQSKTSRMLLTVDQFLGGGGQGEVYRVALQSQPLAVKWFFPHYLRQDPRLRERLEKAIQIGAPS